MLCRLFTIDHYGERSNKFYFTGICTAISVFACAWPWLYKTGLPGAWVGNNQVVTEVPTAKVSMVGSLRKAFKHNFSKTISMLSQLSKVVAEILKYFQFVIVHSGVVRKGIWDMIALDDSKQKSNERCGHSRTVSTV